MGGIVAAAERGCSRPLRCGWKHPGAMGGIALLGGGGSCRAAGATEAPMLAEEDEGTGLRPRPPPPPAGWGERGSAAPPPVSAPMASALAAEDEEIGLGLSPPPPPASWGDRGSPAPPTRRSMTHPSPPGSPRLARLGAYRFAGLGASGPRAGEGRVPTTLGRAMHWRVAGRLESGRAWRPGGPVQATRTARPAPRVRPRGRAPGDPARPGAGLWGSPGPPNGQRGRHGQLGSSG